MIKKCPKCGEILKFQPIYTYKKGNYIKQIGLNLFCPNIKCRYEETIQFEKGDRHVRRKWTKMS